MKKQSLLFQFAGIVLIPIMFVFSCKKSDNFPSPQIKISITTDTGEIDIRDTIQLFTGDTIQLRATVSNSVTVQHSWKLNDSLYSTAYNFVYAAPVKGNYILTYDGGNSTAMHNRRIILRVSDRLRPIASGSTKYITRILAYQPAPGQFINESIADSSSAKKIIGQNGTTLNLGGFGGYVIFSFDHSIINRNGMDLAIFSNPTAPPMEWSKPGIVMVSHDRNGNGLADDPWYELSGSEYNSPDTKKNYQITYYNPKEYKNVSWKDSQGDSGVIEINSRHTQNYYPLFASNKDSIIFTGTRLKNTFSASGTGFINTGFNLGYADNYSAGDNYAQNGYNSFDIAWARDQYGAVVNLPGIDFVKVYTAQNNKGDLTTGEISTSIRGAMDLNMP